jgi:hypothetical protein
MLPPSSAARSDAASLSDAIAAGPNPGLFRFGSVASSHDEDGPFAVGSTQLVTQPAFPTGKQEKKSPEIRLGQMVGVAGAVASLLPTHGLFVPKHHRPSQRRLPNAESAGVTGVDVLVSPWKFGSVVTQMDTHYALAVSRQAEPSAAGWTNRSREA